MDIMMPERDGREAVRRIWGHPRGPWNPIDQRRKDHHDSDGRRHQRGNSLLSRTLRCIPYEPIDLAELVEQMKRYQLIQ
jgi:CheY-like chemotaxis protein